MSDKGYSEAEMLHLCRQVIHKARECQKLMGDRTARFVKEPTTSEILAEQEGHEVIMHVRHKKGDLEK